VSPLVAYLPREEKVRKRSQDRELPERRLGEEGGVPLVGIFFEDKTTVEEGSVRGLVSRGVVGMQTVSHV
jgi:hypothetical protein